MRLTILGNNGPFPAPGGATSGYLLQAGNIRLCFDLGSGTLSRLTGLTPPEELNALLLSHWHYDHCADVLPLIFRLEACAEQLLHLYAPVDEASPVRKAVQACRKIVLHDVQPGDSVTLGNGSLQVTVHAARHPVPAVMYRVSDGVRTFCYTGDTNAVEGLTNFAAQADFLLADGLFTESAWAEGKPHLSAAMAARLARDADVRQVVITHLNPTIDPDTLLREARAVRLDATLAGIGETYEF